MNAERFELQQELKLFENKSFLKHLALDLKQFVFNKNYDAKVVFWISVRLFFEIAYQLVPFKLYLYFVQSENVLRTVV